MKHRLVTAAAPEYRDHPSPSQPRLSKTAQHLPDFQGELFKGERLGDHVHVFFVGMDKSCFESRCRVG